MTRVLELPLLRFSLAGGRVIVHNFPPEIFISDDYILEVKQVPGVVMFSKGESKIGSRFTVTVENGEAIYELISRFDAVEYKKLGFTAKLIAHKVKMYGKEIVVRNYSWATIDRLFGVWPEVIGLFAEVTSSGIPSRYKQHFYWNKKTLTITISGEIAQYTVMYPHPSFNNIYIAKLDKVIRKDCISVMLPPARMGTSATF